MHPDFTPVSGIAHNWFVPVDGISYNTCLFPNGNATVALCTLWAPPEKTTDPEQYAIIGPCYSIFGTELIVRTLLANPQITTLIVTGPDLSGTAAILHDVLCARKELGTSRLPGEVGQTRYGLGLSRPAVILPVEPAPVPESPTGPGWPGVRVVGESLWTVWPRVLREVVGHGAESPTAYGTHQRELLALTWVFGVEATWKIPPWVLDAVPGLPVLPVDFRDALNDYAAVHFLGTELPSAGVAYTYADRLRNQWDDQIARCVETLRKDPEQRRAWASTWAVGSRDEREYGRGRPSDAAAANPPCLVGLWFRRDADGSLFTHATFRSHDLYKAGVQNAWGLCRLAEHVAKGLDWSVGKLAICSLSGHVYSPDWPAAERVARERGRSTYEDDSARSILRVRELPGGTFDPGQHEERIAVDLLAPDGRTLATVTGATAEQAERRVLRAGWVSTLSHAAWLGRELARAEGQVP